MIRALLAALLLLGTLSAATPQAGYPVGPNPTAPGQLSNALGADVNLSNIANFFDGPTVAQGTSGTWWASGQVNVTDTSAASMFCKLWDGTTTISSASAIIGANTHFTLAMSGFIASPAANIRISCRDASNTTGKIQAGPGGVVTNGAYVAVFRIN